MKIAIIGAGPSGLMAAEALSGHSFDITVFDRKPSVARKFLIAGRGGLNLTHSEPLDAFLTKYTDAQNFLKPAIQDFAPSQLQDWSNSLGEPTFIGSSGRVFPKSFKASPLLRAWLERLSKNGVQLQLNKNWHGWNEDGALLFDDGAFDADITLLALGGASWPKLGSDGSWVKILDQKNIAINPLKPANCGFHARWSDIFKNKFSGKPIKTISLKLRDHVVHGEVMIDENGIEGGAIYALSRFIRDDIDRCGECIIQIDLKPALDHATLIEKLRTRKRESFSSFMEKVIGLPSVSVHLLREYDLKIGDYSFEELAHVIKGLPLRLRQPFPIETSISSAGGIDLSEMNDSYMLHKMPGVFVAGEMMDWEAPTGGYLLQACFSTAKAAAKGIIHYASKS